MRSCELDTVIEGDPLQARCNDAFEVKHSPNFGKPWRVELNRNPRRTISGSVEIEQDGAREKFHTACEALMKNQARTDLPNEVAIAQQVLLLS